jgi:hypothetical protein
LPSYWSICLPQNFALPRIYRNVILFSHGSCIGWNCKPEVGKSWGKRLGWWQRLNSSCTK